MEILTSILEWIGIAFAVLFLLFAMLGIAGFLASLLYFDQKFNEADRADEEEIRRNNENK